MISQHRCGLGARPVPSHTANPGLRRLPAPPRALVDDGVAGKEQVQPPGAARLVEVGLAGGRRREVALRSSGDGSAPPQGLTHAMNSAGPGPVAALRNFFLPRGFPHSVTPDYLAYQLATVPAHISGWMSHSLATSSMIQALGMGMGPGATVASSAAIKWITKDGLGAAGRLIVGGRLASVFDEDPRRWRMVAEGVSTLGLALEIATQLFPGQFVALAGGGTLAKSMAKGMGRPCFRVIQTHFSATNNVGDVAAKEEVWEVAAQLLGLASSVLLLQALEAAGRPELAVPSWAAVHSVHVALRYAALRALRFPYPNQKRAAVLTSTHVSSGRVPGIEEGNEQEHILLPPSACRPHVEYGCSLDELLAAWQGRDSSSSGGTNSSSSSSSAGMNTSGSSGGSSGGIDLANLGGAGVGDSRQCLVELVQLYAGERYLLTWRDGTAWVGLLEGAGKVDMLRAMYQAAWLDHHDHSRHSAQGSGPSSNGSSPHAQAPGDGQLVAASLAGMCERWPAFEAQAAAQGWQLDKAVLPQGTTRLLLE